MRYSVTFELSPTHAFGLPEPGITVVPGPVGSAATPIIDTITGKLVGHGTLSRYREDLGRLQGSLSLPLCKIRLNDNFAFVETEAHEPNQALSTAISQVDLLLKALAADRKSIFYMKVIAMSSEDGKNVPLTSRIDLGSFAFYDIEALKNSFEAAAQIASKADDRLRIALNYFEHALFYWSQAASKLDPSSETRSTAASIAILHLWKCCTTLLGDPARKRDGYQRRYRELGFNDEYKTRLDHLKKLRDDHDVAHSRIDQSAIPKVESEVAAAIEVAREAIQAYAFAQNDNDS